MDYKQLSMADIAYEIMTELKQPADFYKLYDEVAKRREMTEEEKANDESLFYTNITLDGRMITVGENCWDLRSRHKFDEVHIDMNDVYSDDDDDSSDDDADDGLVEDDYNN